MSQPTAKQHGYALTTPCANCPYRTDVEPYLRPERARELANNLTDGGDFACHKTTRFDDEGEVVRDRQEQQCAGALILQEKSGQLGQSTRIAERLGLFNASKLDIEAPVYSSIGAFVHAYEVADGDQQAQYCAVVGSGCENPPGFGGYGQVQYNTDPAQCTEECTACGEAMCDACTGPDGDLCRYCAEDDEGDQG